MDGRRELMNRLIIKVTTNEEGMKVHFNELLKEMVEHDEITGYIILEDICLEGRGMSIFSDHENGYMDDYEYREECKRMNRQDRYEREHLDEPDEEEVDE